MYSSASQLLGVELSEDFVRLQKKIVEKYRLNDRVQVTGGLMMVLTHSSHSGELFSQVHFVLYIFQVLQADICTQDVLLQSVDILIMNNVFEFFMEPIKQVR